MLFKYFLSILLFCLISYINGLLAVNLINLAYNFPVLPDVGFLILPKINRTIPTIILIIQIIYFILIYFRKKYISDIFNMIDKLTFLFFIRIFTFTLTYVPPTFKECISPISNAKINWLGINFLFFSNDNTCIDYMFSGHVVYMITLTWYLFKFSNNIFEKILIIIFMLIAILTVIASRIHYTVDVVVAITLSLLVLKY